MARVKAYVHALSVRLYLQDVEGARSAHLHRLGLSAGLISTGILIPFRVRWYVLGVGQPG